eukprot:GHRR01021013.1.p1 GENE.GHRR01021013.1~~GHRR01021013.1.p1  ORF type:complete len:769 (+),score=330.87 GHRR01021013.1:305-2611(+)
MNRSATAGPMTIERDTRLAALINGNNQAGMLVLHKAMTMAIDKAQAAGFGIVGTNHTCTSTGALGYYAEQVARQGLIGIVFAQSPEFVAPHGSKQAIFGTNPIAIGIPAENSPVVMDMATAAYAWFGLLEAKTAGRPIPSDVALNADGQPTTDPSEVLKGGTIRVFDRSHKGSNLALMVELLAGPLVGAAVADKLEERNWGNLLLAVDPELLGDKDVIKARTQMVLNRVKAAEKLPGVSEILLPSERGNRAAAQHISSGMVPIEANLYQSLKVMASKADAGPGNRAAAAGSGCSNGMKLQTLLLHPVSSSVTDPYDASGAPLYQTATFGQPSATEGGPYDYTRSGNPTRTMLEEQWAVLEGGCRALAFTSGMAALAVVTRLVSTGGHIVAGDDIYGGTSRLLSQIVPAAGITVSNVDMTDINAVKAALIPGKTQLVMLESPTNPRMQVCDIRAIVAAAHAANALVCVDNSFLTPLYQQPLQLGADISMTSGTKYIGGHGDVTLGMLAVSDPELGKRLYFLQNAEGAGLAPMDCWLALRGLKTMALRMERSVANAEAMAQFLSTHPLVKKLNYASLPSHTGAAVHGSQATSGGAVLSFETGDLEVSRIIVEQTKLFKVTVSFGNVISLISLPCFMSHASIPAEVRAARGLPDDLVRISAGIEDAEDLVADLKAAMDLAWADKQQRMQQAAASSSNSSSSSAFDGPHSDIVNGTVAGSADIAAGGVKAAAAADVLLAAAHGREQELLQRIQQLESQLAGYNGQPTSVLLQ